MKNLWPFRHQIFSVPNPVGIATDQQKYFVLTGSTELHLIDTKTKSKEVIQLDQEVENLIDMTYLQMEENLVFITANGSIFTFSLEVGEISMEGEITTGISAARWAPSQEYLAIFARNGSLLIHNSELDFLKEVKLNIGPEATLS